MEKLIFTVSLVKKVSSVVQPEIIPPDRLTLLCLGECSPQKGHPN